MHLNRHALRVIRERSGLTVTGLARRADVSQPHLSNIEQGRRQASPVVIGRLAAALKVPIVALLAEVDDEPESPQPPRRASGSIPVSAADPSATQPVDNPGVPMPIPSPDTLAAMPAVQMPDASECVPPSRPTSRRAGRAAAGLVVAGAVLGSVVPAHAEVYYTGQCTVSDLVNSVYYYRTFQARIVGSIENGTGKYIWNHYDYRYTIDLHLQNGASSDELVAFKSGYSDGLSTPWQSPDNHGSTGDWVTEGNWKGAKSYWGSTKVNFYAAFDVPKYPDPHCSAATALV